MKQSGQQLTVNTDQINCTVDSFKVGCGLDENEISTIGFALRSPIGVRGGERSGRVEMAN